MLPSETSNGSEGTAYRYTKKVLMALPNRGRLQAIYEEIARNKGISSWTRAAYMDLRAHFFKDGQCKIRFAPGAARIAFGTLELGTGDEQLTEICNLHDILRIISIAHSTEYTRHLAPIGGEPMSFQDLFAMYGSTVTKDWSSLKRKLKRRKYGERKYRIIELDCFETANKYYEYTKPYSWCHLGSQSTFDHYRHVDTSRFTGGAGGLTNMIRLYLAVLPGFETMTVNDEMYGESMLGIDIGPGGRLVHVNNRWNHAHDCIDHRKGDNKYDEMELSELLGGPFFELCPPYSAADERAIIKAERKHITELNKPIVKMRKVFGGYLEKGTKAGMGEIKEYVDPRDGKHYRTRKIGGIECMLDPVRYVPNSPVYRGVMDGEWVDNSGSLPTGRNFYMFTLSETGIFQRCEVPFEVMCRLSGVDFIKKLDIFKIERAPFHVNDIEFIFTKPFQVLGRIGDEYRTFDVGISYYAMFLTDQKERFIPFDKLHTLITNPYDYEPDGLPHADMPRIDDSVASLLTDVYQGMYPGKEVPKWGHVDYMIDLIENCHMGTDFDLCDDLLEDMTLSKEFTEWKMCPRDYDDDPITNRIMKAFHRAVRAHGSVMGISRSAYLVKSDREVTPDTIEKMNAALPGNNATYDNGALMVYGSKAVAEALPPGWRTPTLNDMYRIIGGLDAANKPEYKIPSTYAEHFFIDLELDGLGDSDSAKPKPDPNAKKKRVGGAGELPMVMSDSNRYPRIVLRNPLLNEMREAGYSDYISLINNDGGREYFPMFYEHATDPEKRLENTDEWSTEPKNGIFATALVPEDVDPEGVHMRKKRVLRSAPFNCPCGANRYLAMDHSTHLTVEDMRFVLFPVRG